MMNKMIKAFALFFGLVIFASACVEEANINETVRPAGTKIIFSASSGYQNSDEPTTRTEYSGIWNNTNQFERINWLQNDKLSIWYGTSNGIYKITNSITPDNEYSNASVAIDSGEELVWSSADEHEFYAMYPATGQNANASITSAGVVSGLIPKTQTAIASGTAGKYLPDMNYAYMVSKKTIDSSNPVSTVNLPFCPAMTAFEFNLSPQGAGIATVKNFVLESSTDYIAGNFSFAITGETERGADWNKTTTGANATQIINNANKDKTITVDFGAGISLNSSTPLNLTIFTLPIPITNLSVKIQLSDNSWKTLALKDNETTFHTFDPCKKYIISNTTIPGEWEYIVEPIDDFTLYGHLAASQPFEVQSYRRNQNGTIEKVAWKAQYSSDGVNWYDTPPTGSSIEDFTVTSATGQGINNLNNHEDRTIDLVENTHYTETETHTSAEILRSRTPVTNYDLSLHDVHGNEILRSTANTYVVSRAGTYRFPCVYGNAILRGDTNDAAYNPIGSTKVWKPGGNLNGVLCPQYNQLYNQALNYPDVMVLGNFRNALNAGIQDPYIFDDLGHHGTISGTTAAIIWQDEQIMTSNPSLITVDGHQYIEFTISQSDIKPGNIVIALRGSVGPLGADSILWSWQIWVTEKDLHAVDSWMPYNLGWNVDGEVQTRAYTNRECYVRIQQIAPSDDRNGAIDNAIFYIIQLADTAEVLEKNIGSNPYYQWGRKDPMLPGQYSTVPNQIGEYCMDRPIYPGSGYTVNSNTQNPNAGNPNYPEYGRGVRRPHVAYIHSIEGQTGGGITGWVGGPVTQVGDPAADRSSSPLAYNLWDASLISSPNGEGDSKEFKTKTVYDPCPVGFVVPYQSMFSALGNGVETNNGGRQYGNLFLPYAGARIFYNKQAWGTDPNTGQEWSALNPGPPITPALYLRHINDFGLYWTDAPNNGTYHSSRIFIFERTTNTTDMMNYTKGTAASIRPMVDPRF